MRSFNAAHQLVFLFGVTAMTASSVLADASIRGALVGDDFQPIASARITKIDDHTVAYVDERSGRAGTLPLERLVRVDGVATAADNAKAQQGFNFIFRDGQRWAGTPGEMTGDDIEWKPAIGKPKRVPLKQLAAIASMKADAPTMSKSSAASDELLLVNGDVTTGVVSASTSTNVTVATPDGSSVTIDWANVSVARFAASGATATPAALATFRVSLSDGRVVDGQSLQLDEKGVRLKSEGDADQTFAPTDITMVEYRGGHARMLADLPTALNTYTPYFPSGDGKSSANASPGGLTIAGKPIHSSLSARPRSVQRWQLDGTAKTFVTRYGIVDGRPLADVSIRVKLDDAVVLERAHVRGGALSDLLKIPLGAAKALNLEVDYGDTYDVQDDFYWIEPALISD